ncbi:MAG: hypothetical protein L3J41_16980 [Melioribacteraceae bacterium]|nr:hypothetical protein [Melioribacteraceae bacterium]
MTDFINYSVKDPAKRFRKKSGTGRGRTGKQMKTEFETARELFIYLREKLTPISVFFG